MGVGWAAAAAILPSLMWTQGCPSAVRECPAELHCSSHIAVPVLAQADDLKDRLLRTLADMENLRERTARTTAEAKQFAVQVGGWLQG